MADEFFQERLGQALWPGGVPQGRVDALTAEEPFRLGGKLYFFCKEKLYREAK
jgi:hypothetical protein